MRWAVPANEKPGEEEDSGIWEGHGVHAPGGGNWEAFVDDHGAGEGHEHAELRRYDAPGVGQRLGQHVTCRQITAAITCERSDSMLGNTSSGEEAVGQHGCQAAVYNTKPNKACR